MKDPAVLRLFHLAAERGLIIQIVAWLEDERCPNPLLRVPIVDLGPLPALLEKVPNAKVQILNGDISVDKSNQLVPRLQKFDRVSFDFAMLDGMMALKHPTTAVGVERVLFGSYSPMFYFESALLKVREASLTDAQNEAIFSGNARRLIA